MADPEYSSADEVLEALADGKQIDWERLEKDGVLSDAELEGVKIMAVNWLPDSQNSPFSKDKHPDLDDFLEHKLNRKAGSDNIFSRITPSVEGKSQPEYLYSSDETARDWGDFHIIRKIGEGGMGIVYEAEQMSLKRKVALKVLPPHLSWSSDAIDKFRREAEAGGRQRHPGIIAVHAMGKHEGMHFIAQELVEEGYTLADPLKKLKKTQKMPVGYFRDTAKLILKVAEALGHAHGSGVIHRDVKPSNILLTREGQPKVTDFGLAKVEDALSLSRSGDLVGTPYYMSPEQTTRRKGSIDHRTDIFSLGVTLFELLTLNRPFKGETSHEVLKCISTIDPPDPVKVNSRVPSDLSVICLKAMEKDPSQRYQTMEEFAEDLKRFLQGEVILARPSGPAIKIAKRIKRNPLLSLASGVALVSFTALVFYILWSYPQVLSERKIALDALNDANRQREEALAAKKLTEEERKKAETEMQKTRMINDFFREIYAAPHPGKSGPEVKVVEVLDLAVEELDKGRFDKFPDIDASLRETLGTTFKRLEEYAKAEKLLLHSLNTRREVLGEEHQDTLSSMNKYGMFLHGQSRHIEAESIYREVLRICEKSQGADHPMLNTAQHNLGTSLLYLERSEEAEPLIKASYSSLQRDWNSYTIDDLNCMSNLACVHVHNKKYDEAEKLYREALEKAILLCGEKHPKSIEFMMKLGVFLTKIEKTEEAEALLKATVDLSQEVYGENLFSSSRTQIDLGIFLQKQGRYAESEKVLREVLEIRRCISGSRGQGVNKTMRFLGAALLHQGRESEAAAIFEERWRLLRKKEGDDSTKTFVALKEVIFTITKSRDHAKAESLIREVLDVYIPLRGEDDIWSLYLRYCLADQLFEQGRSEEGESLFCPTLEATLKKIEEAIPGKSAIKLLYGKHLLRLNKEKEAEKLFLSSLAGFMKCNQSMLLQWRIVQLHTLLAELYTSWGDEAKAVKHKTQLKKYVP